MVVNEPIESNEINLRDLLETLFKGKVIIAIITIQAIILSGLISFFALPEVYESRVVIMANPFDLDRASTDINSNKLIEYLTSLPTMTLQTYIEQVQTVEVLNATITALDLRDSNNKYINAASLRGILSVKNIGGTNLIEIVISHGDPEMAARIANTLADQFIEYVSANTRTIGYRAVEMISQQLIIEEQNLQDKSQALATFWQTNRNIDVLRGDVEEAKKKIVETRSRLIDLSNVIEINQASLAVLADQIKGNPALDINDFSINVDLVKPGETQQDDDQSDATGQIEIGLGSDNLSAALLRIEINRLQTELIDAMSEKSVLDANVADYETSLIELQIELTESEYKYNALNRELILAQQSYDAYQQKYKEAMLTVASDIGKSSVIVTSAASVPVSPVQPNKMMNILMAALIGFVLSVIVVLFRDYWIKSKPAAKPAKK